jgi:hypothetical protein
VRLFPGLRRTGRLLLKLGYVSEPLPSHANVAHWSSQVLRLLPLEVWLSRGRMATDTMTPYEPPQVRELGTLVEITRSATVGAKNETMIPGLDKS